MPLSELEEAKLEIKYAPMGQQLDNREFDFTSLLSNFQDEPYVLSLTSISSNYPEVLPQMYGYGILNVVYNGQEIKLKDLFSSIPR